MARRNEIACLEMCRSIITIIIVINIIINQSVVCNKLDPVEVYGAICCVL